MLVNDLRAEGRSLAEAPLPAQMNQINIRRCADRQF